MHMPIKLEMYGSIIQWLRVQPISLLFLSMQCGLLYKIIIKQPSPNINTTHCLMIECMHGLDSNWSLKSCFVSSFLISLFPVPNITNPSQKCRAYAISVVGWDLNTNIRRAVFMSWAMESAARDGSPDPSWLEACRAVGDDPDAILAQNIAAYDILGSQGEKDRKRGTIV